jgi:hypothetical protein
VVVRSVVVVLVSVSELLQPATKTVPVSSATTVKSRKKGIVLVIT